MTKKLIFIMLVFLSFKNIVFAGWPVAVSTGSAKDNFNSARNTFVVEHNTTDGIHENVRVRNSFQVGGVSTSTYNFYVSSSSIILPTTNISGAGSGSTLDADTIDLHDSIYFQTALTTTSWVAYDSYRWRGMDSTATWKVYDSGKWDGIDSTDTFLSATKSDSTAFQLDIASVNVTTALMGVGAAGGDLMYYDGVKWIALSSGAAGQYLETGTIPTWNTPAGAGDCTKADDEVITGDWHFNNTQTTFTAIVVEGDANFSDADSTVTVAGYINANQVLKGWISFDGTGTISIDESYNVASIADGGVGIYTVTWDVDFGAATYCPLATSSAKCTVIGNASLATGSIVVATYDEDGASEDSNPVCVIAIGGR